MKRSVVISLVVALLLGLGAALAWRAYRQNEVSAALARQAAVEASEGERLLAAQKAAAAEAEAARLAAAQAKTAAEEVARATERLREIEARATAERAEAEASAQKIATEREALLRAQQASLDADAARLAEARTRDGAASDAVRAAALEKLRAAEDTARNETARLTARLTALREAEIREATLAAAAERRRIALRDRIIYSSDYKRRPHYYAEIMLTNAELTALMQRDTTTPPPAPIP